MVLVLVVSTASATRTAAFGSCGAAHGFQLRAVYQPLSRFWPLQGIESGIYLAAAVVLLAVATWLTRAG
jgi:hypothetical protein